MVPQTPLSLESEIALISPTVPYSDPQAFGVVLFKRQRSINAWGRLVANLNLRSTLPSLLTLVGKLRSQVSTPAEQILDEPMAR